MIKKRTSGKIKVQLGGSLKTSGNKDLESRIAEKM